MSAYAHRESRLTRHSCVAPCAAEPYTVDMTPSELKRIIEALILCHDVPMTLLQIKQAIDLNTPLHNDVLRAVLDDISTEWQPRGVNLVQVATGWRFQSAADLSPYLERMRAEKPASYSRAVFETLAIIAYRQPVTRGDIEDIRGVTVSSNIIKTLEERGWIDSVGHRDVPGRPSLLATTKQFLDDLGLRSLDELPPLNPQSEDAPQLELDGFGDFAPMVEASLASQTIESLETNSSLNQLDTVQQVAVLPVKVSAADTEFELPESFGARELAELSALESDESPPDLK